MKQFLIKVFSLQSAAGRSVLIILLMTAGCGLWTSQAQTTKASFTKEVEVDVETYIVWSGYVIDSTWLNVWLPNGDLPRRENGTYLYWKVDASGNLIPKRKIDYRLPIFKDQTVVMKKEEELFK